jgi:uncharacterized phage protein gp47/JayE
MPLTAEGFQRKLYDDYLEEMEQKAIELFGDDVNLSENGPMGKWIRMLAFARAEENELAEQVYLSGHVDHAEGINLDYAVKGVGMYRQQGIKATVPISITVDAGSTIPSGTIFSTIDGIEFQTTASLTDSDNDGLISTTAEAAEVGVSGNIAAGTLTVIVTPAVGLLSVTNPTPGVGGQDPETDKELRDRHASIGANGLSSTINGIRSVILNDVPAVSSVVIVENATNATDGSGRPPNSFEAIVYGGNSADIAAAILKAKPAGIRAYGSQSVTVVDDSGNNQTIGFSFAAQVTIYVKADVTTNTSFPVNGNALVITEVIKYIGGTDSDNTVYSGLGMGQSVVNAKLAANILANVPGVDDVVLTFSTDGVTYAGGNKTITITQTPQTDANKVVVL